ncbi:jerky protein homolog-like [Homalodisca vitripennis]|uniref:jerky protein homolog-like n=1 Tax=Homalodisca vitripennis TaxID=197043 RepID=UPI001EEABB2E|nr:jerky protein homolog-like [Homalodisca vitripennis]
MSLKRKRVVVSLETKLSAIKRLDKGESLKKVAADLGVAEVTVGDWRRKRKDIEQWVNKSVSDGSDLLRKTMKKGEYEQTSEALFLWFSNLRGVGSPISGPMLQAKAVEFNKRFKDGEANFSASDGWLDRWKKRYGIRQLNISGEKLSADSSEIESFSLRMKELILDHGLTSDQIFNCDETGLNFRMLPNKTLAAQSEKTAPGYKKSKERVTLLMCSNSSGSLKLRPLLIGKSKNPRAFKNIQVNCLPTMYRHQRSAWMDGQTFKEWFFDEFVRVVEAYLKKKNLPRKAILLMDNAPSHPDASELVSGDIKAVFSPPNVTSLIQPLDQGVLEAMKRHYRRRLLQVLLTWLDEGITVTAALKKITVKDVSYWIVSAWDDVRVSTLQKSWRKLFQIQTRSNENDNDNCVAEIVNLANQLPTELLINDRRRQRVVHARPANGTY